jgi:LmbE family N-acetylglucosaminyl deacetylase
MTPSSRRLLAAAACVAAALAAPRAGAASPDLATPAILQEMRAFRQMGTVLMIAAHPDDENTNLIAYFSLGRAYRMGYLSVTRGDGGQDLLGPEIGSELGVIRTQELLAARRIDGGRQFFTRARDFGFSKDYQDTLSRWDKQEVLSDIVRVIREFRPDVIVTRFSTIPGNTHGHHTASAVLAKEAFRLAGDPKAFPEQLSQGLTVWQPKRIFWNAGFGPRGPDAPTNAAHPAIRMSADPYDPLLGESFGEIATESRSMHKSQGLGGGGFGGRGRGAMFETFELLDGEPAEKDIMDGVDTTWGRVPGGAEIGRLAGELIAHFNMEDPAASVPAVLDIRARLAALPADPVVDDKRQLLDRILEGCLGLYVETTAQRSEIVPGDPLNLQHRAIEWTHYPVKWVGVRYPSLGTKGGEPRDMAADRQLTLDASPVLPADTPLSGPYWLREEGTEGMFRVDDPKLIGRPESPPVFPVEFVFEVGGQTLVVPDEPVQVVNDPLKGESRLKIQAVPPVVLAFADDLDLFAPGTKRTATVEVTASRPVASGSLKLEAPAGWTVEPASQAFSFAKAGEKARFSFTVGAPAAVGSASIEADAVIDGRSYHNGRKEIRYEHIPLQVLQPVAREKAVSLDLAIRGKAVGYVPGAGDDVGIDLAKMGYAVTTLEPADLTPERLKGLDALVFGVRAFDTHADLAAHMPAVFAFVQAGGNVIEQYNRDRDVGSRMTPFSLQLSQLRVTNQKAPMTLLAPDHPAFTTPNRIAQADFDGWVQERGTYFASRWDAHFTPLIACSDRGEEPLQGGLLVARDGKGCLVYTGLTFFRQLPAGVPGAYRLFANLISLGK